MFSVLLLLLVGMASMVRGTAGPIRSVVVLPFDNLMGDASQDYFVDSVSAALTTHLSEVRGLEVLSRATGRQLKQADTRIADIGRTLNVEGVVEGEVLRSGENVRILVKLIRTSTDRSVWSRPYDDSFANMISLQQRIASDIADAAGLPRPQAVRRPQRTPNPQAYEAYLKGLSAKGLQRYEGFARAVSYFGEAITLQPDFAEAHAELALTQTQFLYGGPVPPHEAIGKAEAHARVALGLDDSLGQAHWAMGLINNLYHWRFEEGQRSMQLAAKLPGGRPSLDGGKSFEEALAAAERGRDLDRNAVNAQVAVASVYRRYGQHERALEEYRKAVAMSPNQPRLYFNLGITLIAMGRLADAIPEFETAVRDHNTRFEAYLGYAYAKTGRTQDARKVLNDLEDHRRDGYVSSFGFALIHDALQERERALAALQRAYEEHAVELALRKQYPPFTTIASDPQFQSIMKSVGLPR